MSPEYLRIGKILGTHGLKGHLKVKILSDFPERFSKGNQVYLYMNGFYKKHIIKDVGLLKDRLLRVKFDSLEDVDEAKSYRGFEIFVSSDELIKSDDKDSFHIFEIINLNVFYKEISFGKVKDVIEAGGGQTLVIEFENREYLVPFIKAMVDVDLHEKRLILNTPDGLIENQNH